MAAAKTINKDVARALELLGSAVGLGAHSDELAAILDRLDPKREGATGEASDDEAAEEPTGGE